MTYKPWPIEETPQWRRMARQALEESRRILDAIPPNERDIGDPNHPANSGLFGYDTSEFLDKQYRRSE